jgi:hypothetical protein
VVEAFNGLVSIGRALLSILNLEYSLVAAPEYKMGQPVPQLRIRNAASKSADYELNHARPKAVLPQYRWNRRS